MKCIGCKFKSNKFCSFYKYSLLAIDTDTCISYKEKKEVTTNTIKRKANKQEEKLAKEYGAKLTPQSGAQETSPSDMVLGNYIIESKATSKKSISLKHEWLDILKSKPILYGKIPTLIIDFSEFGDRYVILEEEDFKKIVQQGD